MAPSFEQALQAVKDHLDAAEVMQSCEARALFLSDTPLPVVFLLVFLLIPVTAGGILYLMRLSNPKLAEPIQTTSPSQAAAPRTPVTPPPAYEEHTDSAAADHPSSYADVQWSVRPDNGTFAPDDDAAQFVKGTAVLAALASIMFLVALAIQALSWCQLLPTAFIAVMWVIYAGLGLFALRGLGAWLVLFRNLWGKKGRERWVLRDDVLVKAVLGVVSLPYVFAVMGVRACQQNLCVGHKEEEDVELGVTPSSARFPPDAREEAKDVGTKEEQAEDEHDPAETSGLLAGREEAGSS